MREMKDSGVEWIGKIPGNWNIERIKFLCTIHDNMRQPVTADKRSLSGAILYDYYGASGVIDKIDGYTIDDDVILVGEDGSVIKEDGTPFVNELHGKAWINNHAHILKPKKSMDFKYAFYMIKSNNIHNLVTGMAQPKLTQENLKQLIFCVPFSLHEQQTIVSYLDRKCSAIDTAISHIQKQIENLEEYKKSVITQAVTKGLDPNVKMKDSGVEWIGEIPEGWKVGKMKNIADTSHPYAIGDGDHGLIKNTDYKDSGIPYIRVLNLTWGYGLNKGNLVYISEEKNALIKNSELHPNDVLVAKTGATIGKTAIIPDDMPRANTTAHVGKVTISPKHSPKFYYYVLQSDPLQRQIALKSSLQATRPELGNEGLANLIIPVASLKVEQVIAQYLDEKCASINEAIAKQRSLIDKMNEYKQSVIYNAVTGKINCTT